MRREHLGYQKDLIPSAGYRPPDQFLRLTRPIHLGAIDMRHAEVEAALERSDRSGRVRLLDIPGALADDCDFAAARPELSFLHEPPAPCTRAQLRRRFRCYGSLRERLHSA